MFIDVSSNHMDAGKRGNPASVKSSQAGFESELSSDSQRGVDPTIPPSHQPLLRTGSHGRAKSLMVDSLREQVVSRLCSRSLMFIKLEHVRLFSVSRRPNSGSPALPCATHYPMKQGPNGHGIISESPPSKVPTATFFRRCGWSPGWRG